MSELDTEIIPNEDLTEILSICNSSPYKLDEKLKYRHFNIKPEFKLIDNITIRYQLIRKKLNSESNIPLFVIPDFFSI